MSDSIVDRTFRSALQQWEGNGSRGPRPTREAFAHLEEMPAPLNSPAPPAVVVPLAGQETPADPDAVKAALRQMQQANPTGRGPEPAA